MNKFQKYLMIVGTALCSGLAAIGCLRLKEWREYKSLERLVNTPSVDLLTKEYFVDNFAGRPKHKDRLWRMMEPWITNHYNEGLEIIRSGDQTLYLIACDTTKWRLDDFGQNGRNILGLLDDRLYELAV